MLVQEFTLDDLNPALALGAFVLLVSVAAVRLAARSGLPSLLLYLGHRHRHRRGRPRHRLRVDHAHPGPRLQRPRPDPGRGRPDHLVVRHPGLGGAGGGAVDPRRAGVGRRGRRGGAPLLHVSWTDALLVGAVLSSTDAAAVFSVLRRVPLPRRVTGMLEAESGFNDAPGGAPRGHPRRAVGPGARADPWWALVLIAVLELAGGAAIGLAIGYGGGRCCAGSRSASSALFSHRRRRPDRPRVRRRRRCAHQRVHRDVPGGARAGQHAAAAPPGRPRASPRRWAGSPRSGCSCCSGCSPARPT